MTQGFGGLKLERVAWLTSPYLVSIALGFVTFVSRGCVVKVTPRCVVEGLFLFIKEKDPLEGLEGRN